MYPLVFLRKDIKNESEEILHQKVENLVAQMTPEEKISMLHGHNNSKWEKKIGNCGYNPGVPRLGIPELRMYDGPAGVHSNRDTTGLPIQHLLGSTWSDDLAYDFGMITARENAAISGNCQLGDQVDICRIPHYVRNKDAVGEDPCMAARMARQQTRGIQDQHVMAVAKHYFAYTQRPIPEKNPPDLKLDEQTIHEMYLPGHEAAAAEGAASIMTACTVVNGEYVTASEKWLEDILRKQWKWNGFIMSDWKINPRMSVGQGLDMEMPDGTFNNETNILKAIENGQLTWAQVDMSVRHILNSMGSCGLLSLVELDPQGHILEEQGRREPIRMEDFYDDARKEGIFEENAWIAGNIVEKGGILLKNQAQTLPVTKEKYASVAMIGPGAVSCFTGENQERSFGTLSRFISPAEAAAQWDMEVKRETGIDLIGEVIPSQAFYQDPQCTKPGLKRTYGILAQDYQWLLPSGPAGGGFEIIDSDLSRDQISCGSHETGSFCACDPVLSFDCCTIDGKVNKTYKNGPNGRAFKLGEAYTWTGYLKVQESGTYRLMLQAIGGEAVWCLEDEGRMEIVGKTRPREGAHWPWSSMLCTQSGMDITGREIYLSKDKSYKIMIAANAVMDRKDMQIRLAWVTPSAQKQHLDQAEKLATDCDLTVLFVYQGSTSENVLEPSLSTLDIDQEQKQFITRILQCAKDHGKRTAAVLNISRPVLMSDWLPLADAVLNMWLPGQEGGTATARLLSGLVNPGGKLTVTFPKCDKDTLIFDEKEHYQSRYIGIDGPDGRKEIRYDEGIFFGYRWYEKKGIKPLFPFGFGLSYTTFEYSNMTVCRYSDGIQVRVDVTNTGDRSGDEIVQIYAGKAAAPDHIQMAEKQLVAYARVENIRPGQTKRAVLHIPTRLLSYWDPKQPLTEGEDHTLGKWVAADYHRTLMAGASSQDIRLKIELA